MLCYAFNVNHKFTGSSRPIELASSADICLAAGLLRCCSCWLGRSCKNASVVAWRSLVVTKRKVSIIYVCNEGNAT